MLNLILALYPTTNVDQSLFVA